MSSELLTLMASLASADDGLRTVPAFTAEEEKRDIESLSLADLARVQSDLVGLTSLLQPLGPSSSGVAGAAATTNIDGNGPTHGSDINSSITSLEAELHRLPQADSEAYYQAVEKCPDQVDYKRKLVFLDASRNDVQAAASKLAEYWKTRVEVFGTERAYLPMTLTGAMKDEVMHLASLRCVWRLLPQTDTAGRTVLFFCAGRRNYAEYSVTQEVVSRVETKATPKYVLVEGYGGTSSTCISLIYKYSYGLDCSLSVFITTLTLYVDFMRRLYK